MACLLLITVEYMCTGTFVERTHDSTCIIEVYQLKFLCILILGILCVYRPAPSSWRAQAV